MVLGESLLTRFQEDSFPSAQPINRDVQLRGNTFDCFSPKDSLDGGGFLCPSEA